MAAPCHAGGPCGWYGGGGDSLAIFDRGVAGVLRSGDGVKAFWKTRELVAVRIPDLQFLRQPREQWAAAVFDGQGPFAVFALLAGLDFAAEIMSEELDAKTDAKDREAELENLLVGQGSVIRVNAGRPAGENDCLRLEAGHIFPWAISAS